MCFDTVIYRYKYIYMKNLCSSNGDRRARKTVLFLTVCVVTKAGVVPFVITCCTAPIEHSAEQICLKARKKYCCSIDTLLMCIRYKPASRLPNENFSVIILLIIGSVSSRSRMRLTLSPKFTNKPHFLITMGLDCSICLVLYIINLVPSPHSLLSNV